MKVIAAVVVGGAAITGGRGTLAGTVLGVVLLGAIGPALTFLGVSAYWERAHPGRHHPGRGRASTRWRALRAPRRRHARATPRRHADALA